MAEPENERISSATVLLLLLLTFPLSVAGVPALPPGLGVLPDPGPRVHSHGLLDHETVLDELTDVLPRVGVRNLVDLVRVEPDLVAAALHHRSGEPLLQLERRHLGGLENKKLDFIAVIMILR